MSGAAFDQLPYEEGRRLELIEGEILTVVRPTPNHQSAVTVLLGSFLGYFGVEPSGWALSECEFALGEDDRLGPDVALRLQERWSIHEDRTPIPVPPDIVVEVVSPNERTDDSLRKIQIYLKDGVQEVWRVSGVTQQVFIHRAGPIAVLEINDILSPPLLPGWEIPLRETFRVKRQP